MFLKTCLTNTAAAPAKTLMHCGLYTYSLKNVLPFFFNVLVPWPLKTLTSSTSCILHMTSVA